MTEADATAQRNATVKTHYPIVTDDGLDPVWVAGAYWMSVPRAAGLFRSRPDAGGTPSGGACRRSRHTSSGRGRWVIGGPLIRA